jgi:hypothetical protein
MNNELSLRAYLGARYLADQKHLRELEQAIAPDEASGREALQNQAALTARYRHMLDDMIALFGGVTRVRNHYDSLRRCRRAARLPVSERDGEEQFLDETYGAADLLRSGSPVNWVLEGDYYGECDRGDE